MCQIPSKETFLWKIKLYIQSIKNCVVSFLAGEQHFSMNRENYLGNYQLHGFYSTIVRSYQKLHKERHWKVSALLMILLQLHRSRVGCVTQSLSLRSLKSAELCKMDGASKAITQADWGDRHLLPCIFHLTAKCNLPNVQPQSQARQQNNLSGKPFKHLSDTSKYECLSGAQPILGPCLVPKSKFPQRTMCSLLDTDVKCQWSASS